MFRGSMQCPKKEGEGLGVRGQPDSTESLVRHGESRGRGLCLQVRAGADTSLQAKHSCSWGHRNPSKRSSTWVALRLPFPGPWPPVLIHKLTSQDTCVWLLKCGPHLPHLPLCENPEDLRPPLSLWSTPLCVDPLGHQTEGIQMLGYMSKSVALGPERQILFQVRLFEIFPFQQNWKRT